MGAGVVNVSLAGGGSSLGSLWGSTGRVGAVVQEGTTPHGSGAFLTSPRLSVGLALQVSPRRALWSCLPSSSCSLLPDLGFCHPHRLGPDGMKMQVSASCHSGGSQSLLTSANPQLLHVSSATQALGPLGWLHTGLPLPVGATQGSPGLH